MFSMLVFMCRDPGDTTSKVSCCVETSYCFKNRDFDAIVKVPVALPLKMSLTKKRKYGLPSLETLGGRVTARGAAEAERRLKRSVCLQGKLQLINLR